MRLMRLMRQLLPFSASIRRNSGADVVGPHRPGRCRLLVNDGSSTVPCATDESAAL